jgi:cysteine synthase
MVSQLFCRTFFGWSIGQVVNVDTILNCAQISEGIGQGRVTANLEGWGVPARDGGAVDFWCQVTDEEALPLIFDLLKQEGFCMGGSTAINIGGKCLDLLKMFISSGFAM